MTAAPLLTMVALMYAVGVGLAWRRGGVGMVVGAGEALRFMLGWLAMAAALLSPLEAAAGRSLSAHMLQHLLLVVVTAPLWATAGFGRALLAVLPRSASRGAATHVLHRLGYARRYLLSPLVACALYVTTLWLWHLPGAYQGALLARSLHAGEHAMFLALACVFWASVLPAPGGAHRRAGAVAALLGASFAIGGLGALMALSPAPWYPSYVAIAAATGADALRDQQLAGVIMWMPMGAVHAGAALFVASRWLAPAVRRDPPRSAGLEAPA